MIVITILGLVILYWAYLLPFIWHLYNFNDDTAAAILWCWIPVVNWNSMFHIIEAGSRRGYNYGQSATFLYQIGWVVPLLALFVVFFMKIVAMLRNLANERKREEESRKYAEAQRNLDRQRQMQEEQNRHRANIDNLWALNRNGVTLYERAPVHLQKAADYLKTAQTDLSDKVYAPFWEAIEGVANNLALFNSDVKALSSVSKEFSELYPSYAESVSPFPITPEDIDALIVAETVSNSMSVTVREAHKDPNYSALYEQRRTTAAVIEGFANLQEAINGMREEILSSIATMQETMESHFQTLQKSIDSLSENIGSHQESFVQAQSGYMKQQETASREAIGEAKKSANRQFEESKMLRQAVEETRNTLKNMHAGIPPIFGWD